MAPEEKRRVQIGEDGTMGAGALVESAKRRGGWREARRKRVSAWTVVFVSLLALTQYRVTLPAFVSAKLAFALDRTKRFWASHPIVIAESDLPDSMPMLKIKRS